MMFLVNGSAFQFPELPARYLALFLSFLLGSIVRPAESKPGTGGEGVYWVPTTRCSFSSSASAPPTWPPRPPPDQCRPARPMSAPCSPRPGPVPPRVTAQRSGAAATCPTPGVAGSAGQGAGRERAAATGTGGGQRRAGVNATAVFPHPLREDRRPAPQEQFFKRW